MNGSVRTNRMVALILAAALGGAGVKAPVAIAATTITIRFDDSAAREEPAGAPGADRLHAALRELRWQAMGLQGEAARRLAAMVPTGTDFEATLRVVASGARGRPTSRDVTAVPLSITDFLRDGEPPLDVDALFAQAVRGVYRVAFRAAGGLPPQPAVHSLIWDDLSDAYGPDVVGEVWRHAGGGRWNGIAMKLRLEAWVRPATWTPDGLDRFVGLLSRMQMEGTAALAASAPRVAADPGRDPAGVGFWSRTALTDWPVLGLVASALDHGATGHEIDRLASDGFGPDGPLVRLGYRMALRIDARTGRRALIAATVGGPIGFVDAYLATHPDGPDEVDLETARVLRAVSREIRGVGAFRPLD